MPLFIYPLFQIPDPGDRSLAAACGGDLRAQAFQASEQILRMLASFHPGTIRAGIRFAFSPGEARQFRLRAALAFGTEERQAENTIGRLASGGPLNVAYTFGNPEVKEAWELPPGLEACCEIVRREDGWVPEKSRRERNPFIPPIYYTILPFEPRSDNDWSGLDRMLDRLSSPALVEVVVQPTDISAERLWHYRYVTLLMQVNQLGDDLNPAAMQAVGGPGVIPLAKVRDPMADDLLREQEDVHRKMREPHVSFAVRCWTEKHDDALLVAATVAESCLQNGRYRLLNVDRSENSVILEELKQASSSLTVSDALRTPEVWGGDIKKGMAELKRMSHLAAVDELKALFRLPVGSSSVSPRTIRRHTDPKPVSDAASSILIGDDLEMGVPGERTFPDDLAVTFARTMAGFSELRLDESLLKKHMFIAGVPGSGKTMASFNLLAQMAYLKLPHAPDGVPFLVIEPAKTEYRTFKDLGVHPDPVIRRLAEGLRVFSVGNEEISPFRFNPLWYPDGITLDEHIGSLLSCFEAAMPMGGPLQGLLAEAIEDVYANPPRGVKYPRLRDLLTSARRIVDKKGYEGEVLGNLKAALDVRLGLLVRRSLGKVFDCEEGIPAAAELYGKNVVLEMDYLTPEHACLMTLFVLSGMREYIRMSRRSGAPLSHITMIEEAHNIVGRAGAAKASEEVADPKAFAANYISRMLAELRALGEGILIADQLPSAVAPEVVKNTGTKLALRLVAKEDREDLGATMLLDEEGQEELARLRVGEAFLYSENLYRPRRVRTLASHVYLALGQPSDKKGRRELGQPPGRDRIVGLLERDGWHVQARDARAKASLRDVRLLLDDFELEIAAAEDVLERARQALVDSRASGERSDPDTWPALIGHRLVTLEKARKTFEGAGASALLMLLQIERSIPVLRSQAKEQRIRMAARLLPKARRLDSKLGITRDRLMIRPGPL